MIIRPKKLQAFAQEVEEELMKGNTSLILQVCRHITGKDSKVSSFMVSKLVEWTYGKATEHVEHTGTIEHEHRTITERFTDDELAEAERLIETAFARSDKG